MCVYLGSGCFMFVDPLTMDEIALLKKCLVVAD